MKNFHLIPHCGFNSPKLAAIIKFCFISIPRCLRRGSSFTIIFFFLIISCSFCQEYFWEPTGELPSGVVRALAINPNNKTTYTAIDGSGIYRSIDNGENWTQINNGLTHKLVKDIVVKPNGNVFAGTDGGGVFRSIDNGDNWAQINNGLTNTNVLTLFINSSGDIFAGAWFYGNVFRSTDNGDSWVNIGVSGDIHAILHTKSNCIFAGTQYLGAFRSTDDGESWENVGLRQMDINSFDVNSAGDIFAATSDGVYSSTDDGDIWVKINNGLTSKTVKSLIVNESGIIFAGTINNGVFRSSDNGENWIEVNTGLTDNFVFSFVQDSSWKLYCGTRKGVFRSKYPTSSVHKNINTASVLLTHRCYPNPFTGKTRIQFFLKSPAHVSLKIYNSIGLELTELCGGYFNSGQHFVDWRPKNPGCGIYFYRIKIGRFAETGKLILLK